MAVREAETVAEAPGWIARLNDYGERHARLIISLSTALVILTVLLFAKFFYDRSILEKAEKDLSDEKANTVERLKELKLKYNAYPVAPRIVWLLANRYNHENNLEEAKKGYEEFIKRFPGNPLFPQVEVALNTLESNLKFERTQKDHRLREAALRTHPRRLPETKDPRLAWSPLPQPRPVVEIVFTTGPVKFELFEDQAPNATASFIKLCDQKYFDGVKLDLVNTDERLQTVAKTEGRAVHPLAFEPVSLQAVEYALVLIRKPGAEENLPGEFQILLKPLPDLKDATILGVAVEGQIFLKSLKKDEVIKSAKVLTRRTMTGSP